MRIEEIERTLAIRICWRLAGLKKDIAKPKKNWYKGKSDLVLLYFGKFHILSERGLRQALTKPTWDCKQILENLKSQALIKIMLKPT